MTENKKTLYDRVYEQIVNRRDRLLKGNINCIPWGLPRFEEEHPGLEQGKNLLFTANSKVGKTQICDFLILFNIVRQIIDENLDIKVKIFYFTLEMTSYQKMLSAFSHILYIKEGLRIAPKDLRSTKADNILSEEILKIIERYEPYFKKIEEIVEFIDDVRNPTGMYDIMRKYALANGKIITRNITLDNGEIIEVEDRYEPNNPDEYVIMVVDHISLIQPEKQRGVQLDLRESISLLSANYMIKLRNRFNHICVAVQQQAQSQESVENKKFDRLMPTLDGLGTNKTTQQDFDVIFGLYSPFRHKIPEYMGYDITFFKDNIRFLEIIGGREGGGGVICPLYFDGATNYFKELPLPTDQENLNKVSNFIKHMRNSNKK